MSDRTLFAIIFAVALAALATATITTMIRYEAIFAAEDRV